MIWRKCPGPHPEHARELVRRLGWSGTDDAARHARKTIAMLSEGICPACPHERLQHEDRILYGRTDVPFGRCASCRALWRLEDRGDGPEYFTVDPGRLVDV